MSKKGEKQVSDGTYIAAGAEFNTVDKHIPAPVFRRKFRLENGSGILRVEITVVGLYRIMINGRDVTKGQIAPYISNPDHCVYRDEYVITPELLRCGENVLDIILGNGFSDSLDNNIWSFESASFRAAPKFCAKVFYDGKPLFATPDGFKADDSPITFDDLRCGEHYDARLEGVQVFKRTPIIVEPPKGEVRRFSDGYVRNCGEYPPVAITKCGKGYIYDFGQVSSGVCRLDIDGVSGQTVSLTYGELVTDGELDISNISFGERSRAGYIQRDEYICKDGRQRYTPHFTYHGFRYVLVEGITDGQATAELLTFIKLHSELGERWHFKCGDETINKIQACTLESDKSNFYFYPSDCPQREKNGWTGDVFLSAEQLLYNFDCGAALKEWLHNVAKAQRADGKIPAIVPTDTWGYDMCGGPAWDGVIIELPYQLYRSGYGEDAFTEHSSAIYKYLGYLSNSRNDSGLIAIWLGDWCEPGTLHEWDYSTPLEVSDTLVSVSLCDKAAFLAELTDNAEVKDLAVRLSGDLKGAFRDKYIRDGRLTVNTQTALALAIAFGIFKEDELAAARSDLLNAVHEAGDHFKTGVIGVKYLFDVLSEMGESSLCYKLITQHSFPSYAYWTDRGANTLWESFNELDENADGLVRKDGERMPSLNHHFWGSVSAWFYKYLAGIRTLGASDMIISPHFIPELNGVKATCKDGRRQVTVSWRREGDRVILKIDSDSVLGKVVLTDYLYNGAKELYFGSGRHEYELIKA